MAKKEEQINHELVPTHKVLSESDKKKVLERFGISEAQLPRILTSDPALIGLSPKVGDVIHISRKDAVGENEYYRLVVKG